MTWNEPCYLEWCSLLFKIQQVNTFQQDLFEQNIQQTVNPYLGLSKDNKQEKCIIQITANRCDPILIEILTNSSCVLSSWFSVINNTDVLTFCTLTLFLGNKAPCQISTGWNHSAILTTGGQVSSEDMGNSIAPTLNRLVLTVPNEQLTSDLEICELFVLRLDLLKYVS